MSLIRYCDKQFNFKNSDFFRKENIFLRTFFCQKILLLGAHTSWELTTPRSSQLPGAHNSWELSAFRSSQLPGALSSQLPGALRSQELTTPRSTNFEKNYQELPTSQELPLLNFRSSRELGVRCSRKLPGGGELPGAFFDFVDRPLLPKSKCHQYKLVHFQGLSIFDPSRTEILTLQVSHQKADVWNGTTPWLFESQVNSSYIRSLPVVDKHLWEQAPQKS